MSLSITLDWLAFTFKEDSFDSGTWLHTFASNKGATSIAPTNGYRSAYRTKDKVDVMWNVDRPEMGYHVIIAGTAIRNLCEHMELDQKELIKRAVHAGASITRLDLAKDLQGESISLDEIYQDMEQGNRIGTARTVAQIHSNKGGNTIYVGSRQSEKFIRIYDKRAQSGGEGKPWYRFEVEAKGAVARTLAHILLNGEGWERAFDTVARHMVDLPDNHGWSRFFVPGVIPVGFPKIERSSNREAWIDTQVTPAVIEHYMENRDSAAIKKLRMMLAFVDREPDQSE